MKAIQRQTLDGEGVRSPPRFGWNKDLLFQHNEDKNVLTETIASSPNICKVSSTEAYKEVYSNTPSTFSDSITKVETAPTDEMDSTLAISTCKSVKTQICTFAIHIQTQKITAIKSSVNKRGQDK